MIQRRRDARFQQKPLDSLWLAAARLREQLERDVAPEPHVSGAIDVAHAAAGEQPNHAVRTDGGAGFGRSFILGKLVDGERKRRRLEKHGQDTAGLGQALYLGRQLVITRGELLFNPPALFL